MAALLSTLSPGRLRVPSLAGLVERTVWLALAVGVAVWALHGLAALRWPGELFYGDSIVLDKALRVARGEALYPPPDRLPLSVSAYTPLYYLADGALVRLVGEGYEPGRALSLLAAVGAAALAGLAAGQLGGPRAGVLAALLMLGLSPSMLLWSSLNRVDLLALALTLAGLAVVQARFERWGVLWAAPLFALALLTKQSYLAGPAAAVLALLVSRRPAPAAALAALALGLFGLGLLLADRLGGGALLWHTVVANVNPFDWRALDRNLQDFAPEAGPLLPVALLAYRLRARPGALVWRLYLPVTLLWLPMLAKVGASSNYWLEAAAAWSVLAAPALVRTGGALRTLAWGLVLVAVVLAWPAHRSAVEASQFRLEHARAEQARLERLAAALGATPGPVLSGDLGLALAARRSIAYEPFIFSLLSEAGLWDDQPIRSAIARGEVGIVVLTSDLDTLASSAFDPVYDTWTPAVLAEVRAHYQPCGAVEGYHFYARSQDICATVIARGLEADPPGEG